MKPKPHGDIDRLPKWAQDYIFALKRDLEMLQKQVDEIFTGNSNIWWTMGIHGNHALPEGADIEFLINNAEISFSRRVDHDGKEYIVVYGNNLKISPQASNSAHLYIEK